MRLVGDDGTAFLLRPNGLEAINVDSLATKWVSAVNPSDVVQITPLAEGNVVLHLGDGTFQQIDTNGTTSVAGTLPSGHPGLGGTQIVEGVWFGHGFVGVQGALISASGPELGEATSSFITGIGNKLRQMFGLDRYGIFAKGHVVAGDIYRHISIRIVPRNQEWRNMTPAVFAHRLFGIGPWFATIGAGATEDIQCDGLLVSAKNRLFDRTLPAYNLERIRYAPNQEDALITILLSRDDNYPDNAPYACFPVDNPGEYNFE